jgi:Flp pilus assembly protein TadG
MRRRASAWMPASRPAGRPAEQGQTLVEMAFVLPIILMVSLGVVEVSYALLHQHVISRITREGANLISRDVTLLDASNAIKNMTTTPVDFANGSQLVLTVLKKGAVVGSANYDKVVLYQRYSIGTLGSNSTLTTAGSPALGPAPDFRAANSDTDTNLQITNLPANVDITRGGLLYVAEVFTTHAALTPLDKFGVTVPPTLQSIAFF